MASITVTSSAELSSALTKAAAGDTLLLAAGNYGDFKMSGLSFTTNVTIESADAGHPAVFRTIGISNSNGLTFENIKVQFTPSSTTVAWESAVNISSSSNIIFAHNEIVGGPSVNGVDPSATSTDSTGNVIGFPCARAVTLSGSSAVQMVGNNISMFDKGIVLVNVVGLTISGNDIHDLRRVPIDGGNVSQTLISGNYLHDIHPWHWGSGDHADFIHIWTVPTAQTGPSDGLVITDNFLDQGNGVAVLGIYLDDNGAGLGFSHTQILNNVVYNGSSQGMRLEGVIDSNVEGNVLLQSAGEFKVGPTIIVRDATTGLSITHNIISGADYDGLSGDARGNVLVQSVDPNLPNFSGNLEGDTLTWTEAMQIRQHYMGLVFTSGSQPWDSAGIDTGVSDAPPSPPTTPDTTSSSPDVLINGTETSDSLSATGNGIVWVYGRGGNDTITGNSGDHSLFGNAGDDTYVVSSAGTKVIEKTGEGIDTVKSSVDTILADFVENLTLLTGAHVGAGNALSNVITGTNRDSNMLSGFDGADYLIGGSAADVLNGGNGEDRLAANGGDDIVNGDAGNDRLVGGGGSDFLYGGAGEDRLVGGADGDKLFGGDGNDVFAYSDADLGQKKSAGFDMIMDFADGDKIDLGSMDSSSKMRGDNEFTFIGDANFTGVAGQLRYYSDASHTYVCADRNGDKVADFTICLDGIHALNSTDFVL